MTPFLPAVAAGLVLVLCGVVVAQDKWRAAGGPLMTRWAKQVSPQNALPEYPRPQMVRERWLNLNGLWDYAIAPKGNPRPEEYTGQILVPFPVESALSGVMERVNEQQRLWYRRTFSVPTDWVGERVLLHFGAVDWEAEVWVNGQRLGSHRGGFDPFSFDITGALSEQGEQEILVAVSDPTDAGTQPRGKQVRRPHGIYYTPVTGIWQTVWLEPVPRGYIDSLKLTPDLDRDELKVVVNTAGSVHERRVRVIVLDGEREAAAAEGAADEELTIRLPAPKLWSPDAPFLYGLRVTLQAGEGQADAVESYFGMRKISLGQDANGITRIMFNNEFVFQYGLLDQGYWPDGLYTAPTDEALRYDIEVTKKMGFNMARKHVKVEPARWYYWADRLGLIVWQDMPSGDRGIGGSDPDLQRTAESGRQFELEYQRMIDALHNHPSIVMWIPFNEGWGQFDTQPITEWTKQYDPSRLVNNASGWTDRGVGDVIDWHAYPGPRSPHPEADRAAVLGEFGGLGLPMEKHLWQARQNWGYRNYRTREELEEAYLDLMEPLHRLIAEPGLSAAVYTQTTDVEGEVNGLLTYDRAVMKIDARTLQETHRQLYEPPPVMKVVVPSSRREGIEWRYTTRKPAEGWEGRGFDDTSWSEGPGGFGTPHTPGAVVRTRWDSSDIWLRREFELPGEGFENLHLLINHDEDAVVYINGVLAAEVEGYNNMYEAVPMRAEALRALRPGRNVIAVHCHQTIGGQYIDVGLVDVQGPAADR
jgi:hypothetical protein